MRGLHRGFRRRIYAPPSRKHRTICRTSPFRMPICQTSPSSCGTKVPLRIGYAAKALKTLCAKRLKNDRFGRSHRTTGRARIGSRPERRHAPDQQETYRQTNRRLDQLQDIQRHGYMSGVISHSLASDKGDRPRGRVLLRHGEIHLTQATERKIISQLRLRLSGRPVIIVVFASCAVIYTNRAAADPCNEHVSADIVGDSLTTSADANIAVSVAERHPEYPVTVRPASLYI